MLNDEKKYEPMYKEMGTHHILFQEHQVLPSKMAAGSPTLSTSDTTTITITTNSIAILLYAIL